MTLTQPNKPQPKQSKRIVAITFNIALAYAFNAKASATEIFTLLADFPACVVHYPKVDQLIFQYIVNLTSHLGWGAA